jgi:hypothetical protein
MRAARGCKIVAKGFQTTGLFPCDKNIFRSHNFPLASEDKDAAPVNHPPLANISNHPSFSSANFLPFTSAEALRASDISSVPSLNLQPNTHDGTENKMSSTYRKFYGATQKKKIKQATKSKTNWLASNALLGPSKRQKRRVCQDPNPSELHQIWTLI